MQTRLFLSGFHHGFGKFGRSVANAVNSVLLCIMYFLGVGSAAIITRIAGTKLLKLDAQEKKSYYTEVEIGGEPNDEYYRQF